MADPLSDLILSYAANKAPELFGDPRTNQLLKEAHYSYIQDRLQKGESLKEQAYNPKALETEFGAERAAPLLGYESTESFKFAQQQRQAAQQEQQFLTGLKQAAESYLGAPVAQTVEGITPEEAGGFYPKLSGPGIGPAESMATANMGKPTWLDYEKRLKDSPIASVLSVGPQAESAQAGKEQRALDTRQLEEVSKPNAAASTASAAAATSNAAVNKAQESRIAQENRIERIRKNRNDRTNTIAHYAQQTAATHPQLTLEQNRRAAKWRAGFGSDKSVEDLKDIPGVIKPAVGNVSPRDTAKLLETATHTNDDILKQARMKPAQFTQEVLDGHNARNLKGLVRAAISDARVRGVTDSDTVMREILGRASFNVKRGSRYELKGFNDLEGDRNDPLSEAGGKYAQLVSALQEELASGRTATGVGNDILNDFTGGGGAPTPAAESPATMPYTGPMTERGASAAPTPVGGAAPAMPPGYLLGPPAVMPPPPLALEATRRREALPRR